MTTRMQIPAPIMAYNDVSSLASPAGLGEIMGLCVAVVPLDISVPDVIRGLDVVAMELVCSSNTTIV